MPKKPTTQKQLLLELEDLRARLDEAEETLRAIRSGEVDALIVSGVGGEQLFTLKGADHSYRILIEDMGEGVLTLTAEGVILYANRRFAEMLKTPLEKVIGSAIHTWIAPEGQRILQSLLRKGVDEKRREQLVLTASNGTLVSVYLSVSTLFINEMPDSFCMVATDLTEQKRSDAIVASAKLARELLAASDQSRLALLSVIEDQKRAEEALRETRDYLDNLIGYANAPIITWDTGPRITRFNHAFERLTGYTSGEVMGQQLQLLFPETSRDESLNKIMRTSRGEYWESVDIPIRRKDGLIRIVLWNSANIYSQDGKSLLATIAQGQDITERKEKEEELQHTLDSLRKAVSTTIQVMVSAVETRDPYTAGHQLRSAGLVRAIATEMGLSQDKIDSIHMAGSIHDIGKLSIPAEILSKPTKLTEIEFSLIQEHASKGYEILKNVEFPWPLAEMVYQHHERMDGSGYPRNLKGEEICMGARILAVADVVEAMASHRPYRPALGIDAALKEIEKNRGVLYDNTVADACLRLFREKGFKFELESVAQI